MSAEGQPDIRERLDRTVEDILRAVVPVASVILLDGAVGERVKARLADAGVEIVGLFALPNSVKAIAPLIGQIQIESEVHRAKGDDAQLYVFHNSPKSGALYEPISQRLLPLDAEWQQGLEKSPGRPRLCLRSCPAARSPCGG